MEKQKPEEGKLNHVQDDLLEEFSITELEDRLEFEAWCNNNCSCPGQT